MISTKDKVKAENERKVFRFFAEALDWAIEGRQIESRSPPEPDILFERNEGHVAFELLSATTPEFQQPLQNAQVIYPDNLPIDQKLQKKIIFLIHHRLFLKVSVKIQHQIKHLHSHLEIDR